MSLTPKQESFCQKYIETGNASEAYRQSYDAGKMLPKTVWEEASRLLADPKVSARVDELGGKHLRRHEVTVDRVIAEYARLAFLDIRKAFDEEGCLKPIHEMDDDTAAAISGIEVEMLRVAGDVDEELEGQPQGGALKRRHGKEAIGRLHKIKLADKKGALDSISRVLGIFVDKTELTGKDGGPIVTQTKEQRDAAVAAALAADA